MWTGRQTAGSEPGGGAWDPVWGARGGSPASRALRQGSPHPSLLSPVSDYVIDDKVAVLQKRDHEGFGFVLRGAKGEEGRAAVVSGCRGCRLSGVLHPPGPSPGPGPGPPRARPRSECLHTGRWFLLGGAQELGCREPCQVGAFLVGRVGSFSEGPWAGSSCTGPPRAPPLPGHGSPLSSARAGRCLAGRAGQAPPSSPAAETPIEEFTPTPAFPALQYLESVDVEGVAWRAGLRTGDFLIEVRPVRSRPGRCRPLGPEGHAWTTPAHLPVCPRSTG